MHVGFGNGLFVALAGGISEGQQFYAVFTSADGQSWTKRASGTKTILNAITYGAGTFAAVGREFSLRLEDFAIDDPGLLTSSDGVSWTSRFIGTAANFTDVVFANQTFVAVGEQYTNGVTGIIQTSSDGLTWRNQPISNAQFLSSVTFGNGLFVAGGRQIGPGDQGTATILTSPDGIMWTAQNSQSTQVIKDLAFGGGLFVAVGLEFFVSNEPAGGFILSSPDAQRWEKGIAASMNSVAYGNGKFVAVGHGAKILHSSDAKEWSPGSIRGASPAE